eukprot:216687_1
MGGFVVNRTMLLKLHIDESNYVTIPIKAATKAKDAIQKIVIRRNIPSSTQLKLYANGQEIDNEANLYEIMQLSSGNHIQIRFISNDKQNNLKNDRDHHLIDSMVKSEEESEDEINSPYRSPKCKRRNKNNRNYKRKRAVQNKFNLVAFNKFSIQQSDDNDVARDQVLSNIEKSLKRLGREQYDVTKINKYGKHQKRVLKLTENGIENIKPATSGMFSSKQEIVTSFHIWENITNSYLEDSKTIRISYKDYTDG